MTEKFYDIITSPFTLAGKAITEVKLFDHLIVLNMIIYYIIALDTDTVHNIKGITILFVTILIHY